MPLSCNNVTVFIRNFAYEIVADSFDHTNQNECFAIKFTCFATTQSAYILTYYIYLRAQDIWKEYEHPTCVPLILFSYLLFSFSTYEQVAKLV